MTDEKLVEWGFDALSPFYRLELLSYDPLGYTNKEFKMYKKDNFLKLQTFINIDNWLIKVNQHNTSNQQEKRVKFVRSLKIKLMENVIRQFLKNQ